jgi:hypothetical protein
MDASNLVTAYGILAAIPKGRSGAGFSWRFSSGNLLHRPIASDDLDLLGFALGIARRTSPFLPHAVDGCGFP